VPAWLEQVLVYDSTPNVVFRCVRGLLTAGVMISFLFASFRLRATLGHEPTWREVLRHSRTAQFVLLLWGLTAVVSILTLVQSITRLLT
jgi:hypothetical protein